MDPYFPAEVGSYPSSSGYGIAKAAEMYDGWIYEMTGFSGHSLKHLIAAVGAYVFLLSFKFRKPLNGKESE